MEGVDKASTPPSLPQLLSDELKLDNSQWEKRVAPIMSGDQDGAGLLEVDSLVSSCIC